MDLQVKNEVQLKLLSFDLTKLVSFYWLYVINIFVFTIGGDDDDDDDDVPDLVENFDEVSKNEANAKSSKVTNDDDGDGDDEDDEKSSPSALPKGIIFNFLYEGNLGDKKLRLMDIFGFL